MSGSTLTEKQLSGGLTGLSPPAVYQSQTVAHHLIHMPFGLRNAGPTFQRTTRTALRNSQSHDVEAYSRDVEVGTRQPETPSPAESVKSLQ